MKRWLLVAAIAMPSPAVADPLVSPILYLNRCRGGCTLHGGFDDARADSSSIPCNGTVSCTGGGCMCSGTNTGTYIIDEFRDSAGNTGDAANGEWNQIMQCVREVYSPYNIMVTDTLPPGGLSHNQGIVAGRPANIGYGSAGIGGIAPGASDCQPRDNVISFTFANIYGGTNRVLDLCAVAAQETAHAYGLDHAYEFIDHTSACNDPMTYRTDCGGQKFFRSQTAVCGEFGPRPCRCSGYQNSHKRIEAIFGAATPITRPPTVTLTAPSDGAQVANVAVVNATAAAQRGIAHVDLWLNNYRWATVKGIGFGPSGQPEASYSLAFPANVPDGVIDILVKAHDDLEIVTSSATVTVTKGAPCTTASTCATGQKCETGRCFWAEPTGELGDACSYPQFCKTEHCIDTDDGMVCSQDCIEGVADSCPTGYVCQGPEGSTGFCVNANPDVGCRRCGAGGDGRAASLFSLAVLALVLRRRR